MSFLEQIEKVRSFLERNQRVSLRALRKELAVDDDVLEELIEELVDVQRVAKRDGSVLEWTGAGASAALAPADAPASSTATPSSSAGELRQLTVMFCDLVESTALSEQLDAEDLRDVVRAYQQAAQRAIDQYGGHVAQYLGDGLLVYFGYPQAFEDSAERAVRAAQGILETIGELNGELANERGSQRGLELQVRVGIHTGPVVVGEMGSGERTETLALGATTNIAARLEGLAEPGSVVISGDTLHLVEGLFRVEDLGTPTLKGIGASIRAYRVQQSTGARSRLDVEANRLTPLTGRGREIDLMLEHWSSVRERQGRTILICGEAGVGKSRLLRALREQIIDDSHRWLESRCSPYSGRIRFHPFIELIETGIGLEPGMSPETKLGKLERAIEDSNLPKAETLPYLASLLSVPLSDRSMRAEVSPELHRRNTIEALVSWSLALARDRPLVFLLEDLHWSDPSTLSFVERMQERSAGARILLLLTFRPEFEPEWQAAASAERIDLARLEPAEARSLILGMTEQRELPPEVLDRIVDRAGGVPIFLEELTKMMLESGIVEERKGRYELKGELSDQAVPATLQDSLMARLDRLGRGKEVAQLASVLGREFSYQLLEAIAELDSEALTEGLDRLIAAEIVHVRQAGSKSTYEFRHGLIQDTAYRSILRRTRREFHARTAEALTRLFPERAAAEPALVAHHFDQAEMILEAIASYRRAASHAKRKTANDEALAQLERALEIVERLPENEARDRLELELQTAIGVPLYVTRGWADGEYGASLERARVLAEKFEDLGQLYNVWLGLYLHHQVAGRLVKAEACAREALVLAENGTEPLARLVVRASLGQSLYLQGAFDPALEHLEGMLDELERSSVVESGQTESSASPEGRQHARGGRHQQLLFQVQALSLWSLGYPERALERSKAALDLAHREGHPFNVASALIYWGWISQRRGQRAVALEAADQAVALCERYGFSWLPWAITLRGSVRIGAAERERAVAEMSEGIASLKAAGIRGFVPHCFSVLAEVLSKLERYDEALEAIEQGLALSEATGQHYEDSELYRLRGEVLDAKQGGSSEDAEGALEEALETARRQRARSLELRAAASLARHWRRDGKPRRAHDLLAPIHGWFTEGHETQDWVEADLLLAELRVHTA